MTTPDTSDLASPEREGDVLLLDQRDQVLVLTMNRPSRLNAVSLDLYRALNRVLLSLRDRPDVRAVVLTGSGRGFSVGADLKAHGQGTLDDATRTRYIRMAQRVNHRIQRAPVPVVAAVNGHAVGAGLELALSADLIVVAEGAKLRLPEVALGTFFGGGVSYSLPARVGLARAREILLLARFFSGDDAARWGLANQAVATDAVLPTALEMARELASLAPVSLRLAREILREAPGRAPRENLRAEGEALFRCMKTEDWKEGIEAFHARRPPRYEGR
jgi:enoyl-CoA hydratase